MSNNTSYTVELNSNINVKAVFSSKTGKAWFNVDGKLFDDLTEANTAAANGGKKIILAADGVLPAGDYTISNLVTLLIPFDAANTLCTTAPICSNATYTTPTVYRKLTMAAGANITVNGAISLSGTQLAGGTTAGAPMGPTSFISMESNSNITVNSGGNLYAWGYNAQGQLGLGDTVKRPTYAVVSSKIWQQICACDNHSLALDENGYLWGWGDNSNGQLGLGDTSERLIPTLMSYKKWRRAATGKNHSAAIDEDGYLWTWGSNSNGQLGLPDAGTQLRPVKVDQYRYKDVKCSYESTFAQR